MPSAPSTTDPAATSQSARMIPSAVLALLLILSLALNAAQRESTVADVRSERGTLILIGATRHEITVAADSASYFKHGIATGVTKIFAVGRFSACTINDHAAFKIRVDGRLVDDLELGDEVQRWITAHPVAEVMVAAPELTELIQDSLSSFVKRNLKYLKQNSLEPSQKSHTALVCVGFFERAAVALSNDIMLDESSGVVSVHDGKFLLPSGFFLPLGIPRVSTELLEGNNPTLKSFRNRPVVQKYRSAIANGSAGSLTANDFLGLSKVCLTATESAAGKKFDSFAFEVAPPNRFAVISDTSGFRSVSGATLDTGSSDDQKHNAR